MDTSFYTAVGGAVTQQKKIDIIANNIANVNTMGYKPKSAVFSELLHYNMRAATDGQMNILAGTGVVLDHTNTNFRPAGLQQTGGAYDYAISGEGFFMLRDGATGNVTYTRDGHFSLSRRQDGFYLVSDSGKLVLDGNQNPIRITEGGGTGQPGIYTFANTDGMQNVGSNEFSPIAKNGQPMAAENSKLYQGSLEMSGVDLSSEMACTVEASRAYSYVLKMIQTSDEVEQTINNLRG